MWTRTAVAAAVVALAGCAGGEGSAGRSAAGVEQCVERLLGRAELEDAPPGRREQARRYAESTYCEPFERRGWVYDDGTLRIAAHEWLEESASCATARSGERPRTIPCDDLERVGARRVLDCALLHHVRRNEVREYVARLERERRQEVECDDGTALDELGAP